MPLSLRLPVACLFALMSSVSAAQSSGTAFVVAPGLLVTNHHVIEDCGDIEIIAPDGKRPATIVDSVEQIDLALLRVYGLRGGAASLRTQSPALLGESATVFGFPLGGALSSTGNFTTGVVSSLRGLGDAAGEIQITAPVQPGNSGGPVLDRAGSVIGVVKSRLSHKYMLQATGGLPQNVNFAVSLDVLADFLAKNNVSFKPADRQAALETTQVAEMAQTFTYKISCTAASRMATAPRPHTPESSDSPTSPKGVFTGSSYSYNPAPTYPPLSRQLKEQGTVQLLVRVSVEGIPLDVTIRQSSGFERLDAAALQTVRTWRFIPATRDKKPVVSSVIVPVVFQRQDGSDTPAPTVAAAPTPDRLVQDVQAALNQKGFNAGPADGFLGPQTHTAIIAAQQALGVTANGLPSDTLLVALRRLANKNIQPNTAESEYASIASQVRFCARQNMPAAWRNTNLSSVAMNTVRLELHVDSTGRVSAVRVFMTSSLNGFDSAAGEAVRFCKLVVPANYAMPSPLTISLAVRDFIP